MRWEPCAPGSLLTHFSFNRMKLLVQDPIYKWLYDGGFPSLIYHEALTLEICYSEPFIVHLCMVTQGDLW